MSRSNVSIGLSEIVCHFEELEDPRSTINRLHPLPSVLTISLMGVLAGADGPTGISKWAAAKKDLLLQALDLPHGIPSRDVIRRVLSALKVDAFQSCFVCWLNSLRDAAKVKAGISDDEQTHMATGGDGISDTYQYKLFNPWGYDTEGVWVDLSVIYACVEYYEVLLDTPGY